MTAAIRQSGGPIKLIAMADLLPERIERSQKALT